MQIYNAVAVEAADGRVSMDDCFSYDYMHIVLTLVAVSGLGSFVPPLIKRSCCQLQGLVACCQSGMSQ